MISLEALPRMYEDLADHFARQGESRRRDEALVLAADAALGAGLIEEAERMRKRLLLTNPNHLLRPYASMGEAMKARDVRDYVADLRKQLPPEKVAKMLNGSPSSKSDKPNRIPLDDLMGPREEPVTTLSFGLAAFVFALGIMIVGGLLVVAFGGMMWQ